MRGYRRKHRKRSAATRALPPPRMLGEIEADTQRFLFELGGLRRELTIGLEAQSKLSEDHKAIAQRIEHIISNPANFERRLPFFERLISPKALAAKRAIECEGAALLRRPLVSKLVESGSVHEVVQRLHKRIAQCERTLGDLQSEVLRKRRVDELQEREVRRQAAEGRRKERAAITEALADRARGTVRETAAQVRGKLRKDHPCPYCGGALGSLPHADHIHPVKKGGLSTAGNMVYVCADCNIAKRDYTLNQFIDQKGHNRDLIYFRLKELEKDY